MNAYTLHRPMRLAERQAFATLTPERLLFDRASHDDERVAILVRNEYGEPALWVRFDDEDGTFTLTDGMGGIGVEPDEPLEAHIDDWVRAVAS